MPTESGAEPRGEFSPAATTTFVRRGEAWSEVTTLDPNVYRVRLGGPLRPGWMVALCGGLSQRFISIDQLHGKRGHDGSWVAELHVLCLDGASDPQSIPYIELAAAASPVGCVGGALKLASYALIKSTDYGGTLLLSFEAEDNLGLLGSVCASLASVSLYPIEVHVETRNGRAYDSMWLSGAGGVVPSAEAHAALEAVLKQSVSG
jgi:hypothetical protein